MTLKVLASDCYESDTTFVPKLGSGVISEEKKNCHKPFLPSMLFHFLLLDVFQFSFCLTKVQNPFGNIKLINIYNYRPDRLLKR